MKSEALMHFRCLESSLVKESNRGRISILKNEGENLFVKKEAITSDQSKLLSHEIKLLNYIDAEDKKISCPRVIETDGKSYLIENYIPGKQLEGISIDHKNSVRVIDGIIENINKLHSLNYRTLTRTRQNWKLHLLQCLDSYRERIYISNQLNFKAFAPLFAFEMNVFSKLPDNAYITVIHNDLNAGNILVDDNNNVSFVDFERWTIGDPLKEVSKLIWFFRKHPSFANQFYKLLDNKEIIGERTELLTAYFYYDILFHFSLYDDMVRDDQWKNYFEEEMELVSNFKLDFGHFRPWMPDDPASVFSVLA